MVESVIPDPAKDGGYMLSFEYFDVGSFEAGFEVCRLLQDELDLFAVAPLPYGDKYGDAAD